MSIFHSASLVIQHWLNFITVDHPILAWVFGIIGFFKVFRLFDALLSILVDTVVPSQITLSPYRASLMYGEKKQNWAVVTGSTAGIGLEFARQLAENKLNVALVSRSPAKLEAVAQEIQQKYKVEVRTHAIDAATAGATQFASLKAFVNGLSCVSVLINNLGVSHEMPVPFDEISDFELHNIVQVNVLGTLEITRAVLPKLEEYTATARPGKRALILTMGSFAGLVPTPLLSVYSGSKMFLQGWSSALAEELKPKKIDVQLIISYLVTSQMSKIRHSSLAVPTPQKFVKSALAQIGCRGGARERAYTLTPYWVHAFMHWGIESVFGVYSGIVSRVNLRMHNNIRERALRKKAKNN